MLGLYGGGGASSTVLSGPSPVYAGGGIVTFSPEAGCDVLFFLGVAPFRLLPQVDFGKLFARRFLLLRLNHQATAAAMTSKGTLTAMATIMAVFLLEPPSVRLAALAPAAAPLPALTALEPTRLLASITSS